MAPVLAVIIATKNRSEEIGKYALPSLENSQFKDFVCVVWDASDDEKTFQLIEKRSWGFPLIYKKAPRGGSSSQRNDAVVHVLTHEPSVRYVLFIDDDSELSEDALEGVDKTFQDKQVWGVNIPHVARSADLRGGTLGSLHLPPRPRVVSSYLHNRGTCPEPHGVVVEWLSGCGMAFRREVFEKLHLFFPEAFQRFGGYALGEDLALSFFLHKKMGRKLLNSKMGTLCHHSAGGARLNIANMAASKWHNFHLLFDAIYSEEKGLKLLWLKLKFKLFMLAAALKLLLRAHELDFFSLFQGISNARAALFEFRRNQDIGLLLQGPSILDLEIHEIYSEKE